MQAGVIMRSIQHTITVNAGIKEVWRAWTTEGGCITFFAPSCSIELVVGGAYEMYFLSDAKPGFRGGEGCTILACQPQKMLSFTWNAPPEMPEIRAQFTHVTVYFESEGEKKTRIILLHDGWGGGELWDRAFHYFDRAWGKIVLPRLQQRFDSGPIDWSKPTSSQREN